MLKTLKFLSFFLCLSLLLFSVVRPIQVNANAVGDALIQISSSAGQYAQVIPQVMIIIVILAGLGYLVNNFDELVARGNELYNTASSAVKDWLDDTAVKIQNGAKRIIIYEPLKTHINNSINNNPTPNGWDKGKIALLTFALFFIVPKVLNAIDQLKPEEVFGSEVVSAIEETNSLLIQIKGSLGSLRNTIELYQLDLLSALNTVSLDINIMKNAVVEWTGNVNDTVATFGSSLQSWIGDLNANVVHYGELQKQWLGNVNVSIGQLYNSMPGLFQTLEEGISDLNLSQVEWLGNVNSSLGTQADRVTNSLDIVSQHLQGLTSDQLEWLGNINSSVSSVGGSLNQSLGNLSSKVDFDSLKTSVEQVGNTLELDLSSLKTTFGNVGADLEIALNTIHTGIQTWGSNIHEWTKNVNANVVFYGQSTIDWLKNINSNLCSKIDILTTTIETALAPAPQPAPDPSFSDTATDTAEKEEDLIQNAGAGKDKIHFYIGEGKDLLTKYMDAFLALGAVLSSLLSISVVGDLFEFSLALGIFALFVNLVSSLSSSDGKKSFVKVHTAKKGG